jgi:hypothetical protein
MIKGFIGALLGIGIAFAIYYIVLLLVYGVVSFGGFITI